MSLEDPIDTTGYDYERWVAQKVGLPAEYVASLQ